MPPDQLRDRLQSSLGAAYTLERELGGAGMARVFVATEPGVLARRALATERRLAGGAVSRNLPDLPFFAAEVVAGERDAALACLGALLAISSIYTPAYLRVDPTWTPLREDPLFEALPGSGRPRSSPAR